MEEFLEEDMGFVFRSVDPQCWSIYIAERSPVCKGCLKLTRADGTKARCKFLLGWVDAEKYEQIYAPADWQLTKEKSKFYYPLAFDKKTLARLCRLGIGELERFELLNLVYDSYREIVSTRAVKSDIECFKRARSAGLNLELLRISRGERMDRVARAVGVTMDKLSDYERNGIDYEGADREVADRLLQYYDVPTMGRLFGSATLFTRVRPFGVRYQMSQPFRELPLHQKIYTIASYVFLVAFLILSCLSIVMVIIDSEYRRGLFDYMSRHW